MFCEHLQVTNKYIVKCPFELYSKEESETPRSAFYFLAQNLDSHFENSAHELLLCAHRSAQIVIFLSEVV